MIRSLEMIRGGSMLRRLFAGALAAALLVTGAAAPLPARAEAPSDRFADGVTVAGIVVGGLTREEATAALATGLPDYAAGQADITMGTASASIAFATTGRRADTNGMLDAAWSIDRVPPVDLAPELAALVHGTAVDARIVVDADALRAAVAGAAAKVDIAPRNGTAKATTTGFARTPALAGSAMPQQDVIDQLTPLLTDASTTIPVAIIVAAVTVAPAVDDADVSAAITKARRMVRTVVMPRAGADWTIAAKTVRTWIRFGMDESGTYRPAVAPGKPVSSLKAIAREAYVAPHNARIRSSSRGSRITNVRIGKSYKGRRLDTAATAARIATAVNARASAPTSFEVTTVRPAFAAVAPAVDEAKARALVSRLRRLGPGWTTRYEVSERNGFSANITIPARTINGFILGPGEEFDFWDALGEVSYRTGYRDGGVIIGGRTNPTGALAGGICSASTTLFNAAARGGLDIQERHNHFYYITRYPRGLDATVSKSGGGSTQNMRFRNDTKYPVLVRGFAGPGWVTFEIWGIPTGRRTTFSAPAISNYSAAWDTVQYTSTLPRGVRKRIEYPVDGFTSVVWRTVRDSKGRVLHNDRFVSGYHRITGIVLVGR